MTDKTAPLSFQATGTPGYQPALLNAAERVRARKRAFPVQVRFADADGVVATLEGPVPARAGDAIVTGLAGEQWPVARAHFAGKYAPQGALAAGADGTYLSLPVDVLALPVAAPFTVLLADQQASLAGQAGDWLVDYGDGTLGVVAPAIFSATYDILESS
ncbi:PGDYG domain-containing protein [Rugamonas sp.]|uniref:PGDYG domain-containing protein n=1 Tax=Rugamonas sp. TaxID=1926287 RepID=UPI0025D9E0C2|nr:PGDYG domain-containing protein [Rugamonas sp.]